MRACIADSQMLRWKNMSKVFLIKALVNKALRHKFL